MAMGHTTQATSATRISYQPPRFESARACRVSHGNLERAMTSDEAYEFEALRSTLRSVMTERDEARRALENELRELRSLRESYVVLDARGAELSDMVRDAGLALGAMRDRVTVAEDALIELREGSVPCGCTCCRADLRIACTALDKLEEMRAAEGAGR